MTVGGRCVLPDGSKNSCSRSGARWSVSAKNWGARPTVAELAIAVGTGEDEVLEALEAGQSYRTSSIDAARRRGAEHG